MKITVNIPDELLQEALAAGERINARRAESERQANPITFTPHDAYQVLVGFLSNLIVQDTSESTRRASDQAIADAQTRLAPFFQEPPPPP